MNHDYDIKVRTKFQFCDEGVSNLDATVMMGKGFVLAYRSKTKKGIIEIFWGSSLAGLICIRTFVCIRTFGGAESRLWRIRV